MGDTKIIIDCLNESTLICKETKTPEQLTHHQSEKELEEEFINFLENQGYEYSKEIRNEATLKKNLRTQIEKLNSRRNPNFRFSDTEWNRFFKENFEGISNTGVKNRTKKIQGNETKKLLRRDDGSTLNIDLIDKNVPQNNHLQVINQFIDFESKNRYDVSILVNGLPIVHIELKKRGGTCLKEIFNQVNRYREESFHGLFEFIQIFIISNGTSTKYFSNTTAYDKAKNSFQFTSWWADSKNNRIKKLLLFAKTFLAKRTILEIITKYCVLDGDGRLMILRPYQIAAIERIISKIKMSISCGSDAKNSGGYIWHTTGSGKTLTSFKAAQLAKKLEEVEKVLFVVDRKDLDSQTQREYEKFSANLEEETIDNTQSTRNLKSMLEDNEKRIIITTIQKLRILLKENGMKKEALNKKMVVIMDECHRSQTETIHGNLDRSMKGELNKFKDKNLFGFTGTPIFENKGKTVSDTESIFGSRLHEYKITDAILDENVRKFLVDYVGDKLKNIENIDPNHPKRIESIVEYTLKNYYKKTNPNSIGISDSTKKPRFNSIFAAESINAAIKYYEEFEKQIKEKNYPLKIAIIYSANSDTKNENLEEDHKDFLNKSIKKYEDEFNVEIKGFNQYRNSVSRNTKKRKIDILIVVNMFLTGFDAPTLNTLWVDKYLEGHNLIQAFSRTNRNFDESKPHGNIVCFRNIKEQVDEAISTFADGDQRVLFVEPYEIRKTRFDELEKILINDFPIGKEIIGENKECKFVEIYNEYNKLSNSLSDDEKFTEESKLIKEQERQDYRSIYLDIYEKYKKPRNHIKKDSTNKLITEPAFELECFRADEINIDYIIDLLSKYKSRNKEYRSKILRIIRMYEGMRKIKNIVLEYLDRMDNGENITYHQHKSEKIKQKTKELGELYNLQNNYEDFIKKCIENNKIGNDIRKIMPNNIDITKQYREYLIKLNEIREAIREILDMYII